MQNRVFRAADVEIDREPRFQQLRIRERLAVVRIDIAEVVPAAARPLRHRVRFANALLARGGIDDVDPFRRLRERRLASSRRLVVGEFRKRKRQILFRHERLRAVLPVYDGERLAPVALARKEPVAELVLRLRLSDALFLEPLDHRRPRRLDGKPVQETGIDHHAGRDVGKSLGAGIRNAGIRPRSIRCLRRPVRLDGRTAFGRFHHLVDRKPENLRELEVALVVRGNGHDRAGAVARENVVGNENRKLVAVHGIDARYSFEFYARLLLVEFGALEIALRGGLLLVGPDLVRIRDAALFKPLRDKRVLRRKNHVRRAEKRIATGRINRNRILGQGC